MGEISHTFLYLSMKVNINSIRKYLIYRDIYMYNIAFKYSFTKRNKFVVWLNKPSTKRIFLEEIATGIGITAEPQPWPAKCAPTYRTTTYVCLFS